MGGGYGGWRLRDIDDLRSLIRGCAATDAGGACGVTDNCGASGCWNDSCRGCPDGRGPGPAGAYWPPELSGSDASCCWSSSAVADLGGDAWGVDFAGGDVESYAAGGALGGVRCVRGGDDDDNDDGSPSWTTMATGTVAP
jgi:hypothetical protein